MASKLFLISIFCFVATTVWGRSYYPSHERHRFWSFGCGWLYHCGKCHTDAQCNSTHPFCNPQSRKCSKCSQTSQVCVQDKHCCGELLCERKQCAEPKKPGTLGARCRAMGECGSGLCCAKDSLSEVSACKKLGEIGDCCNRSGFRSGFHPYGTPHYCPCGAGLTCKRPTWRSLFFSWTGGVSTCVKTEDGSTATPPLKERSPTTEEPTTEKPTTDNSLKKLLDREILVLKPIDGNSLDLGSGSGSGSETKESNEIEKAEHLRRINEKKELQKKRDKKREKTRKLEKPQ